MTGDDTFEPHVDDIPAGELDEYDPMYPVVFDALTRWLVEHAKTGGTGHCVGSFLDWLAADGYRVTPIDPGPLPHELLLRRNQRPRVEQARRTRPARPDA